MVLFQFNQNKMRPRLLLLITFSYQKLLIGTFFAHAHNRRHRVSLVRCPINPYGMGGWIKSSQSLTTSLGRGWTAKRSSLSCRWVQEEPSKYCGLALPARLGLTAWPDARN